MNCKVLALFTLCFILLKPEATSQTDSVANPIRSEIPAGQNPDLKLPEQQQKKRKRNERIALISCLVLVASTFLIYNVRSK